MAAAADRDRASPEAFPQPEAGSRIPRGPAAQPERTSARRAGRSAPEPATQSAAAASSADGHGLGVVDRASFDCARLSAGAQPEAGAGCGSILGDMAVPVSTSAAATERQKATVIVGSDIGKFLPFMRTPSAREPATVRAGAMRE